MYLYIDIPKYYYSDFQYGDINMSSSICRYQYVNIYQYEYVNINISTSINNNKMSISFCRYQYANINMSI